MTEKGNREPPYGIICNRFIRYVTILKRPVKIERSEVKDKS